MKNCESVKSIEECTGMVTRKSWEEFRGTGLFLFVNHFLHIFGWSIVLDMDKDKITDIYPARVKFRGFDEESETNAFRKLSVFMNENASELVEDVDL